MNCKRVNINELGQVRKRNEVQLNYMPASDSHFGLA